MTWVNVLRQDELPEGARRVVEVGGHEILLLHHGGEILAVGNTCPHMGAALEQGEVTDDGAIVCPRHHSVFDLHTGDIREWVPWPRGVGRVLAAISREKPLPVFPTRAEAGGIWIALNTDK